MIPGPMKNILIVNANVYDSGKRAARPGHVGIKDGRFDAVVFGGAPSPELVCGREVVDARGMTLYPGLVDVHTHGRCGSDFSTAGEEEMRRMAGSYAADGTTVIMPTLASDTPEGLREAARRITSSTFYGKGRPGSACFAGIHLEGSFINPKKRGAHDPSCIRLPDAAELSEFIDASGTPLHITSALELDRDGSFAAEALRRGATLALGHTCATYDESIRFAGRYRVSFTHLFNCMPPLHHRDGGPVLAAFGSDCYSELICDGLHIAPSMIAFAYRQLGPGRTSLITDSMSATNSPDGRYSIAGSGVTVKDGIALTDDGALAGSTLTLSRGVENLADFCGIPLDEAIFCATVNPAKEVGIYDICGSIDPGKRADLVFCEPSFDRGVRRLNIRRVICGGADAVRPAD